MSLYYLMSQLPSLDALSAGSPLPISEERLYELCSSALGEKVAKELSEIKLIPKRNAEPSSSLIGKWSEGERRLRLALEKARAERQKKSLPQGEAVIPQRAYAAALRAVEKENPMEAEKSLNQYRLELLEELRPMDAFSLDALYYYAIKLKLLERFERFSEEAGELNYKDIYQAIIKTEVTED